MANTPPQGFDPNRGRLPTTKNHAGPESRTKNLTAQAQGHGFQSWTLHGGAPRRDTDPATGRRQYQRRGLGYDDAPNLPMNGKNPHFERM